MFAINIICYIFVEYGRQHCILVQKRRCGYFALTNVTILAIMLPTVFQTVQFFTFIQLLIFEINVHIPKYYLFYYLSSSIFCNIFLGSTLKIKTVSFMINYVNQYIKNFHTSLTKLTNRKKIHFLQIFIFINKTEQENIFQIKVIDFFIQFLRYHLITINKIYSIV